MRHIASFLALTGAILVILGCAQTVSPRSSRFEPLPANTPTPLMPIPTPTTPAPIPCSRHVQEFWRQADSILKQFDDAEKLAKSTARVALTQPIGKLQDTRRQVEQLDAKGCAQVIKGLLVSYMDITIDGYLAFMRQADTSEVSVKFAKARNLNQQLVALSQTLAGMNQSESANLVEYRVGGADSFYADYLTPTGAMAPLNHYIDSLREICVFFGNATPKITFYSGSSRGPAFCEIWVNGELVNRQTSEQPDESVTCETRIH